MTNKKSPKKSRKPASDIIEIANADINDNENELKDPALFEEMNQVRIPKLETRARKLAEADSIRKRKAEEVKELGEEITVIMNDANIRVYDHGDVHIDLDSKTKVNVTIG
jgi:hypothetical protein